VIPADITVKALLICRLEKCHSNSPELLIESTFEMAPGDCGGK
jgi:hypothetical protein